MAEDDASNNLFAFDDANQFFDDRSASADINTDNSYTSDDAQFDSSAWEFPDMPFTFGAPSSASGGMDPSYPASVWDSPPFDMQQSPSLGFDDASSSNNDAMFLFGPPAVPAQQQQQNNNSNNNQQQQQQKQQQQQQQQRQPTPVKAERGGMPVTILTPAAEEKLRNIAMPPHLQYHSPKSASSPESPVSKSGAKSNKPNQKKRKVSEDLDDDVSEDEDGKPVKKTSHNMIEKRYRNNLNDKISALRDAVPSLRIMSKSARGEDTTEDRQELHGLTPAHKLNKATVLSKATEYIRHLEKRYNRLQDENETMRARIAAFEKLFMAGAMNGSIGQTQPPPTPMQYGPHDTRGQDFSKSPASSADNSGGPSGMIQVPDDMKRILAAQMASGQAYPIPPQQLQQGVLQQQQIHQQQQEQPGRWGNASPYLGKLMVGSLAGLMIMEAAREPETSNEEPQGRGLFALPLHLLSRLMTSLDFNMMGYHVHTSLKLLLVIGTMLWVFVPSLFAQWDKKPKKLQQLSVPQPAPSLASSIQVRRQAWLTAAQSVWIPRQNFLLEASALLVKVAKVSILKLVGAHGYQLLSGATADQEGARAKAWTIAIDSQLAGGDVEINQSRLIITFLASATLPDTPARLMLKSLHIRILLWELGQHRWNGVTHNSAARLARSRWEKARQLNNVLVEHRRATGVAHEDELPDHLAQLVEQDCDSVLNPRLIQRAHNLAFNRDTRYGVEKPIDGMDSVVEDMAIGTPMDAASAWWSTQVLHEALTATLDKAEDSSASRDAKIDLAIHTAPVGSVAQARAIVARAALADEHRGSNIALAVQTVGTTDKLGAPLRASASTVEDLSAGAGASSPNLDMQLTLRCATAIAHLRRSEAKSGSPSTPRPATANLPHLQAIEAVTIPSDAADMSAIGCTAVMELIEQFYQNRPTAEAASASLERLAGGLRLWVGGPAGSNSGLNPTVRHKVIDRCLAITKSLVGMEVDTGYGSLSDDEADEVVA